MRVALLGELYAARAVLVGLWFGPTLVAGLVARLLTLGNVNGYHPVPGNQVAVFLGSNSYSLYLIHAPVARMVFLGMRRFAHWDAAETVFGCTLAMAVAIAAAYAMWLTVERPSIRLSARLKQPS